MKRKFLTPALFIFLACSSGYLEARSDKEWRRAGWIVGFEAGMERARALKRPAFVYFDAEWCSWCRQYKRETLDRPRVRAALARDYVSVIVDFDARPDLMYRYRGKGLPFTLILSSTGRVLNRFVGILTLEDLLDTLAQFADATAPAPVFVAGVTVRVQSLDRKGYETFRQAYLQHLEFLYHPEHQTLSGRFETGATLKRPSPRTWVYLMERGLWPERAAKAAKVERERLLDLRDGGFFNFLDPSRLAGEYTETSKILESNAWISAWLAQVGVVDGNARNAALLGWFYLRETLWDARRGGFWQAQVADSDYYSLPPALRLRAAPPPIDRAKRTDTNAQAAWALTRMGRFTGNAQMTDYAALTVDFILKSMVRRGKVFHLWRDGKLSVPALPQDWFWLLAAGAEVEKVRPNAIRRAKLTAVAGTAGRWLSKQMRTQRGELLSTELAGLIAWVAGKRDLYPALPAGGREWALKQLRIEEETPPDDLIIGLMAWEGMLAEPRP